MMDIFSWMDNFLKILQNTFLNRIRFVGLQGSRARGEATEGSDIDVVVILDKLTAEDIRVYRAMLDTLPHRELICGFLSGKDELLNWEPADLFQFYYDTTPIVGSLDELLPLLDASAVDRVIKIGVCNIYHGCVHNMTHDRSDNMVRGLYKSAFFTVQAIAFKEKATYFRRVSDLREAVSAKEREILDAFLHLKNGGDVDYEKMSEALFYWAQTWIQKG